MVEVWRGYFHDGQVQAFLFSGTWLFSEMWLMDNLSPTGGTIIAIKWPLDVEIKDSLSSIMMTGK